MNTIQLETRILSTLLSFPEKLTDVENILRPQCFTDIRKSVYEAIVSLVEQEIPVDIITINQELLRNEILFNPLVVTTIPDEPARLDKLDTFVKILYEQFLLKELSKLSQTINDKIKNNKDPFDIVSDISESIDLLEHNIELKETKMIDDLPALFQGIEEKMKGKGESGLMSSTFPSLNNATGGIMKTDYIVIFGDYKMGKSTVVEQLFLDIALSGKAVGVFNLEMTKDVLYYKALSMRTGVEYLKLRNPRGRNNFLTSDEFADVKRKAYKIFDKTKIYIEDKVFDINKIMLKMRAWKKKYKIELFVIDYLGLLEGNKKFTQRHLEVANYSRRLKNLAKQIETPIIVLSQANAENRTAESKNPARDADFVISVCKPIECEIKNIKKKDSTEFFTFTQDHFLITVENSRHGKNKQNAVAAFIKNNFVEIDINKGNGEPITPEPDEQEELPI